jgi:hypothetical protein
MLGQQLLLRPMVGQLARIPNHDLIFVDADLDRNTAGVVLVDYGIEQSLTQGL